MQVLELEIMRKQPYKHSLLVFFVFFKLGLFSSTLGLCVQVLELEILRKLRDECFQQARPVTVAFSAFPRPMQADLDAYFGSK